MKIGYCAKQRPNSVKSDDLPFDFGRFDIFVDRSSLEAHGDRQRIWKVCQADSGFGCNPPDPMPPIKSNDFVVFNEVISHENKPKKGWEAEQIAEVVRQLPPHHKVIINECQPIKSVLFIERHRERWEALKVLADALSSFFPGKICIGVQQHARTETWQYMLNGLPKLLELFSTYEIHLTEVSCFVEPAAFEDAATFFRESLRIASEFGVKSYTPWFFFDPPENFRMPGPDFPRELPGLFARDDLELKNPRPAWAELEKYL